MRKKKSKSTEVIGPFRIKEAAHLSGLTVYMVDYLCRNGIVKPTGCNKRGRGRVREYMFSDILILRVVSELLSKGISVLGLKKAFAALQKRGGSADEILKKKYLATDGKNVYFESKGVLELLSTGQLAFAFVLELENVRNELIEKMSYVGVRA